MQDVLGTLKKIDQLSIYSHPCIEKVQPEVPRQKHRDGP